MLCGRCISYHPIVDRTFLLMTLLPIKFPYKFYYKVEKFSGMNLRPRSDLSAHRDLSCNPLIKKTMFGLLNSMKIVKLRKMKRIFNFVVSRVNSVSLKKLVLFGMK